MEIFRAQRAEISPGWSLEDILGLSMGVPNVSCRFYEMAVSLIYRLFCKFHVDFKIVYCRRLNIRNTHVMSVIFCIHFISFMSHIDFKKWPRHSVKEKAWRTGSQYSVLRASPTTPKQTPPSACRPATTQTPAPITCQSGRRAGSVP